MAELETNTAGFPIAHFGCAEPALFIFWKQLVAVLSEDSCWIRGEVRENRLMSAVPH